MKRQATVRLTGKVGLNTPWYKPGPQMAEALGGAGRKPSLHARNSVRSRAGGQDLGSSGYPKAAGWPCDLGQAGYQSDHHAGLMPAEARLRHCLIS